MKSTLKSHKYYDIYQVEDHLEKIGWSKQEIETLKDFLSPSCNGDLCSLSTDEDEEEIEDNYYPEDCAIIKKWKASNLPRNPRIHYWW